MFDFIATLLSWFYDLRASYSFAIIALTLVIMVVLAPLTVRQTRSMLAMQRLQPEVKRLRAKYGGDRERLNQEMMALYQANGVNPLGGCLPLLVQAPVLLVMYSVIRGLTRRASQDGLDAGFYAVNQSGATPDFPDRVFNPAYLDESSNLYQDLETSTEMMGLGIDLSLSARTVLSDSFVQAIPYLLLVIMVGVTTFVQQRQISRRSKGSVEPNPQQQALLKFMPFMLPVFSFGFPAGLVLYWFVSNLFRVGQQAFISKRLYGGDRGTDEIVRPVGQEDDAEPIDVSGQEVAEVAAPAAKSGLDHGRRRPVAKPPKKKRPASKSVDTSRPRHGGASRRVTPKQRDADVGSSSDRSKSQRRKKK